MSEKHTKDFDTWNKVKKHTEGTKRRIFAHPREVWWCSLGVNVGAEIDGKNDKFRTPREIESSNKKTNEITTRTVYVKLTQARVVSNKRLIRKVGVIEEDVFLNIQKEFRQFT